jgi:hypothetical protein
VQFIGVPAFKTTKKVRVEPRIGPWVALLDNSRHAGPPGTSGDAQAPIATLSLGDGDDTDLCPGGRELPGIKGRVP